jgi:hypothetical protein
MKRLIAGVICGMAILTLAGCSTTYEENYPARAQRNYDNDQPVQNAQSNNTCYVRDRDGRQWQASGRHSCHHAVRKCRHWHNSRGMDDDNRCWIDN